MSSGGQFVVSPHRHSSAARKAVAQRTAIAFGLHLGRWRRFQVLSFMCCRAGPWNRSDLRTWFWRKAGIAWVLWIRGASRAR